MGFRHTICAATQSQAKAYQEFKLGNQIVPNMDSEEYFTIPFEPRHALCKSWALARLSSSLWRLERMKILEWKDGDRAASVSYPKLDLHRM